MRTSPALFSRSPRPRPISGRIWSLCLAAVGVLAIPAGAQLPPADGLALGRAGQVAMSSGDGVWGVAPGWALTVLPFVGGTGLGPISGRDLVRAGDASLSVALREGWVRRVEQAGIQRGQADVAVTPVAARVGPLSVQLSTVGVGSTRLPPDAVELLLFGNAGRSGEPAELELRGSTVDAALISTAGVGWGVRLRPELTVRVRGHLSVGHAVLVGRDGGSVFDGADGRATLQLPTISGASGFGPGFGVGLDAGARWSTSRTVTDVVLLNAGSTFSWALEELEWREGETLIRGNGVESDFDPRPATEAPLLLRAVLGRLVPAPRLEIEHVQRLSERWSVRGIVREILGVGLDMGRPSLRAIGAEWRAPSSTPHGDEIRTPLVVAAHLGSSGGQPQLGAGARLHLGPWAVAGGWEVTRGDQRPGSRYALSFTFIGGG